MLGRDSIPMVSTLHCASREADPSTAAGQGETYHSGFIVTCGSKEDVKRQQRGRDTAVREVRLLAGGS